MIKLLTDLDAESLEKQLNILGPSIQVLAIYAIHQKHFAWVKVVDQPKRDKKGTK